MKTRLAPYAVPRRRARAPLGSSVRQPWRYPRTRACPTSPVDAREARERTEARVRASASAGPAIGPQLKALGVRFAVQPAKLEALVDGPARRGRCGSSAERARGCGRRKLGAELELAHLEHRRGSQQDRENHARSARRRASSGRVRADTPALRQRARRFARSTLLWRRFDAHLASAIGGGLVKATAAPRASPSALRPSGDGPGPCRHQLAKRRSSARPR